MAARSIIPASSLSLSPEPTLPTAFRTATNTILSSPVLVQAAALPLAPDRVRVYQRSQDKMHSNFDSVKEQSGLYVGNGGFDVTVGNHTQLNGAVIASQADADKNRLDTGTLGFTDLHNEADYKTEHQGIGMSSGASLGGQFAGNMANTMLAGAGDKGHAEGTTQSAVANGTIVVRDQANQKQDTATLSRDTAHANDSISPIFNKEKEQQRLQTAQMIGEIGSQVGDIVKTQGAIEATRAANNDMKQVSPEKLQQAKKEWEKANPGKTPASEQISKQAWQSYYDSALSASPFAVGGSVQRIVTAATAAVQGLASGDIRAAAAGGAAPYIANLIGHSDLDPASRLMAHAVVNAALAAAQYKNIAAGAAGAVTGELTGMLASEIYGKKPYEMNDREKETVSALATLAAGLSGGLAGSGAADMVTAAQAGKVTVENNNLSAVVRLGATACAEVASCRNMVVEKGLGALLGIGVAKTAMDNLSEADRTVILAAAITGKADEIERLTPEQLAAYKEMVEGQKGTLLPLPALDRPLVDSVLTNPTPEQNRGTTLTTPDQRDQNGSSHTGNTSGVPDTGGNTTVTPIAEQNKDELAYLAGGYEPNKGAVGNMGEFFKQPDFGSLAKDGSQKTSKIYQGQSVYKASGNLSNEIRKGDQFYLDASHMNHLEVFDSKGNFRVVLNLDGSTNPAKTKVAAAEGRKLPK